MDAMQKWVSTGFIAGDLEMSENKVQRWCREGIIPAFQIGREYRVLREEYEQWLDAQRVPANNEEQGV